MVSHGGLIELVGNQHTLVIAHGACSLKRLHELNDRIFVYNLEHCVLHEHDPVEKEKILHYIEQRGCTQVIFAGATAQIVRERTIRADTFGLLTVGVTFPANVLLRHKTNNILPVPIRDQMLTELLILEQCTQLMDYYFIRQPPMGKKITVRGVITDISNGCYNTIFYNGVTFNHLVSMN